MKAERLLRLIDAHAGGDVSRVIVDGAPRLRGRTIAEQCRDFATRYDHLRRLLIEAPRGAIHMCPVLLLPPQDPTADLGVIIMESIGYPPISGSNLFCAVTVALESGFVAMQEPQSVLRVETPIGVVPVTADCRDGRCLRVEFENVPARVLRHYERLVVPNLGNVRCTVTYSGIVTTVVAAADARVSLDGDPDTRIADIGARITRAAAARVEADSGADIRAPVEFTLFYDSLVVEGSSTSCRAAMFQAPSIICRSPTGTGVSALLATIHARTALPLNTHMLVRSRTNTAFTGRLLGTTSDGETAVRTAVSGRAWIIARSDIFAEAGDPTAPT